MPLGSLMSFQPASNRSCASLDALINFSNFRANAERCCLSSSKLGTHDGFLSNPLKHPVGCTCSLALYKRLKSKPPTFALPIETVEPKITELACLELIVRTV